MELGRCALELPADDPEVDPEELDPLRPLRLVDELEPYSAPNSSMSELLLIEPVRLAALLPLRDELLPEEPDPEELPRVEEEEAYSEPNSSEADVLP